MNGRIPLVNTSSDEEVLDDSFDRKIAASLEEARPVEIQPQLLVRGIPWTPGHLQRGPHLDLPLSRCGEEQAGPPPPGECPPPCLSSLAELPSQRGVTHTLPQAAGTMPYCTGPRHCSSGPPPSPPCLPSYHLVLGTLSALPGNSCLAH